MENTINVLNVSRKFDEKMILNRISFQAQKGEIIGLLGANGAGKTTLLKLMSGLLEPDEGEVSILGRNTWYERDKVLKNIGVMIETPVFYEHLTAFENIQIHLEYMGVQTDINQILTLVGLVGVDKKPVSKFSLGMKQKLGIARAISHNPKVLLLDEPINGLDPVAILEVRELLKKLKAQGMTILLSSHILNEVFETVENIVILSNGKLDNLGEIALLKEQYGTKLEYYLIERMRGRKHG